MGNFPVIDTDGHVLERQSDIRKYLEEPWNKRPTPLWPGDQPWDNDIDGFFPDGARLESTRRRGASRLLA